MQFIKYRLTVIPLPYNTYNIIQSYSASYINAYYISWKIEYKNIANNKTYNKIMYK